MPLPQNRVFQQPPRANTASLYHAEIRGVKWSGPAHGALFPAPHNHYTTRSHGVNSPLGLFVRTTSMTMTLQPKVFLLPTEAVCLWSLFEGSKLRRHIHPGPIQ